MTGAHTAWSEAREKEHLSYTHGLKLCKMCIAYGGASEQALDNKQQFVVPIDDFFVLIATEANVKTQSVD